MKKAIQILISVLITMNCLAQSEFFWPSPGDSLPGESEGPFNRLIIEGGTLIDGTGAPPIGPVTIIVENDTITEIYGLFGMYTPQLGKSGRPEIRPGDKHIDARGQYILPGFIETHARILDLPPEPDMGSEYRSDSTPPEYALKLLIAHGVTTVASVQPLAVFDWAEDMRKRSTANEITAPTVQIWVGFPAKNAKEARKTVRRAHEMGVDGLGEGIIEGPVSAMVAGLDEARKLGLNSYFCLMNDRLEQLNILEWAKAGMTGLPHMKGLPELIRGSHSITDYPDDYNMMDDFAVLKDRRWAGVEPRSERWWKVIKELVAMDFVLDPTFSVYEIFRDITSVTNAEWHEDYLHPALEESFRSDPLFKQWGTTEEINWKKDYQVWMAFVNDYKEQGGQVIPGSDFGYFWTIPGFSFIRNLELFQEAGFNPLEVIRAASLDSAKWMGIDEQTGSIEVGKKADILITDQNPLRNLKALYGTGVAVFNEDGSMEKKGGVRYTIKKGVVFDAKAVLNNVKIMVAKARQE